jgi:urocanate hydratase
MGIVGLTKEGAVFASEGRVFLTSSQGGIGGKNGVSSTCENTCSIIFDED